MFAKTSQLSLKGYQGLPQGCGELNLHGKMFAVYSWQIFAASLR
jgi:hypothetical protein